MAMLQRDTTTLSPRPSPAVPQEDSLAGAGLAKRLGDYAGLLEAQQANVFCVATYRRAADSIAALDRPAAAVLAAEGGLRGSLDPERLFRTMPSIGPELAVRLHGTKASAK
jgi:hypothetical protein